MSPQPPSFPPPVPLQRPTALPPPLPEGKARRSFWPLFLTISCFLILLLAAMGWGVSMLVREMSSAGEPSALVMEHVRVVALTDALPAAGKELDSVEGREIQAFLAQFSQATQKADSQWIHQHFSIRALLAAATTRNQELARYIRSVQMLGVVTEPIMRREFSTNWADEEHHSYQLRDIRLSKDRSVAEIHVAEYSKDGSYEKQRFWLARVEGGWSFYDMEANSTATRMSDIMAYSITEDQGPRSARKERQCFLTLVDVENTGPLVEQADLVLSSRLPEKKKGVAAVMAATHLTHGGDVKKSSHYLQLAQRYLPEHPSIHELWTRLHYREQRYAEAVQSYLKYEARYGLDPELCAIAISSHTELKDTQAAHLALSKGLAQFPEDSSLLARLPGDYSQQQALQLLRTGFTKAVNAEADFQYLADYYAEEEGQQLFLLKELLQLMEKSHPDHEDLPRYQSLLLAQDLRAKEPSSQKALADFFSRGDLEEKLSILCYEFQKVEEDALLEQVLAAYQKTAKPDAKKVHLARWYNIRSSWLERQEQQPLTALLSPYLKEEAEVSRARALSLVDDMEEKQRPIFTQLCQLYAELQPQDKTAQQALQARYELALLQAASAELDSDELLLSLLKAAPDAEQRARQLLQQAVLAESENWLWSLEYAAEDLELSPEFIKEVANQREHLTQAE